MKDNENNIIDETVNDAVENTEEVTTPADNTEDSAEDNGFLVLEGETPAEEPAEKNNGRPATYMPRFTEVSENYRRQGDARVRQRLGIKAQATNSQQSYSDEIKLDPTAEFDADFSGAEDAKAPINAAVDESDESISVKKVTSPDDELEIAAEREREEIRKLLNSDPKPAPVEKEEIPEQVEEIAEEEEYTLPDPDADELKVYEFVDNNTAKQENKEPDIAEKTAKKSGEKKNDKEFSNPVQRDGIKDRFLDSLISIRIRRIAIGVFAVALVILELLSATRVVDFNLFKGSSNYSAVGLVDFLLATCIFVMSLPELIGAVKDLIGKKITMTLIPIPIFLVYGIYTLIVVYSGAESYTLFGLLFASVVIPVLAASFHRAKADFIAFKMISQSEDKQVIELNNTRDLDVENKALDGAVDEYKSKLSRTHTASFISDFFSNSESGSVCGKHFAFICGVPFAVGLICAIISYCFTKDILSAMSVFSIIVMLGCPAFTIMAGKISFFHSQRAALATDSTAIGEDAYEKYAGVDVFAFDDTDLFGPEDVNLKRFMLYGDRGNMDNVMRQMCALFAAVGGPLDYMFSGIIDNRMRHKTASNVIIEDDGICGEVAGHKICAGSEDYMRRNGIAIPQAAIAKDTNTSDTIKVMYSAEDGEVNAKFYIRYSFSEEFTSTIPSLRDSGIIPLVYTRDPNVSGELLATLNAGNCTMRVVKLYDVINEIDVKPRVSARMITYGDKLDAAGMIVLAKKYHKFSCYLKFAELCAMIVGVILAIALAYIARINFKAVPLAAMWQLALCVVLKFFSRVTFLKDSRKDS